MTTRADNIIEYCISIAKEFDSRLNRMRNFVPEHNLSSGTANEILLREFLARHTPGDFGVDQGFICNPIYKSHVSKQCDILVHQQNYYPLVYLDGPVKVVYPQAAKMVVEVKTRLPKGEIKAALDNVISARKLNEFLTGVIFAFQSPKLDTVIKHLQAYPDQIHQDDAPVAILLLDQGVIIHNWGLGRKRDCERQAGDPKQYAVHVAKKENNAVVVAFLLFLFFEVVGQGPIWADNANALLELLDEFTDKQKYDITIGKP